MLMACIPLPTSSVLWETGKPPTPIPVHGFRFHVPEPHLEPRVEVLTVELQGGHVAPATQLGEGETKGCGRSGGRGGGAESSQPSLTCTPAPPRAVRIHARQRPAAPGFTSRVLMSGTGVTGSRVHARLVLKENSTDSVPMMVQQELSFSSALLASLGQGEA